MALYPSNGSNLEQLALKGLAGTQCWHRLCRRPDKSNSTEIRFNSHSSSRTILSGAWFWHDTKLVHCVTLKTVAVFQSRSPRHRPAGFGVHYQFRYDSLNRNRAVYSDRLREFGIVPTGVTARTVVFCKHPVASTPQTAGLIPRGGASVLKVGDKFCEQKIFWPLTFWPVGHKYCLDS